MIVNFPHDPKLVALQYRAPGETEQVSLVLYRSHPIILRTKRVLELPEGCGFLSTRR
ncbi:MAG TPA: hypothetical protein PKM78_16980 [Anaerolineae bacterium]|nr:hypothetical protein [Anaerolineae bacterium]HNU05840.1 hypothetical protein [Anaerolineae bacterium]